MGQTASVEEELCVRPGCHKLFAPSQAGGCRFHGEHAALRSATTSAEQFLFFWCCGATASHAPGCQVGQHLSAEATRAGADWRNTMMATLAGTHRNKGTAKGRGTAKGTAKGRGTAKGTAKRKGTGKPDAIAMSTLNTGVVDGLLRTSGACSALCSHRTHPVPSHLSKP
eukprot:m.59414 g.59414  ORF g.59414 m.59414 type:complete len:169 (-) comp7222_c0_seq3:295-801(-)